MRALMDSYWQELCSRYPQWQGASAAFEGAVRILADCAAAGDGILLAAALIVVCLQDSDLY